MSHIVSQALRSPDLPVDVRPWYRQVNATQWRAFFASFLGWTLDGFDFTIISFLIVDIQHSFTISKALAGALATVTLMACCHRSKPALKPGNANTTSKEFTRLAA